jgi:hypothetical protein
LVDSSFLIWRGYCLARSSGGLLASLLKDVIAVRKWLVGLSLIATIVISGISPVSATVVSTGWKPFEVDWFKVVNDLPFEIVWSTGVNNSGDTITGLAAFGNVAFDGTGLALETNVDICAYLANKCADGSNEDFGPAGSGALPDGDSSSLTFSGFPADTSSADSGTDAVGGAELSDVKSDFSVDPPLSVNEPASSTLLAGAVFLFRRLRGRGAPDRRMHRGLTRFSSRGGWKAGPPPTSRKAA